MRFGFGSKVDCDHSEQSITIHNIVSPFNLKKQQQQNYQQFQALGALPSLLQDLFFFGVLRHCLIL